MPNDMVKNKYHYVSRNNTLLLLPILFGPIAQSHNFCFDSQLEKIQKKFGWLFIARAVTFGAQKTQTNALENSDMSKVLKGLTVCASGTLSMTRNEFADLVKENGGKFSKTVTKNLTHLITTEKEFDDVTEKVSKAQGYDIPIVSEDFINDSIEQGKLANVDDYLFDKCMLYIFFTIF